MGLILLPMFALFSLVAGGLGASLSVASIKRRGATSNPKKWTTGLRGFVFGVIIAWAAIIADGIYFFGMDVLGFACFGGFAMFALTVFVVVSIASSKST
jgi:H+/Cl- antiporter ClcA